ncbi:3-phosphoshikimate 1-carboxyvinyltransferase [Cellulomonas xylanilytica]|uniref:3-phosphoshikimate 1-carboxyvinyltransferase n=1 Tax=Cellulomonas xylanilytica TaxID=233583 RepID=A0A510V742_9CELL|nr:3-phosphoshikimate 1-carboxyvinyltransferase [Cellulomonas xylanilytica]GEK21751.1 3-phosphoshikimate 1-carboxyvinyltransferase [Cellulomonas xylanilytica]
MAVVTVPGSKSVTARALLLAAAADGRTTLVDPLLSDDTEAFVLGLRALGYRLDTDGREWTVDGRPQGPSSTEADVFCRDGATTSRFLPALAATGHGTYRFDASDQMRRRPMAPLTQALRSLGADLVFHGEPDHHPFDVVADGVDGGRLVLDAGTSSQFLTALLLVGPLFRDGLTIEVADLVSVPYVGITLAMMRDFGVEVAVDGRTYTVPAATYRARTYQVEPDASSASYFFAAAALLGRTVTVPGLGHEAVQGDLAFVRVLEQMGADVRQTSSGTTVVGGRLHGVTVNMRDISDTMPTLAAIAPYADGPTTIVDVANTRVKECDRLEACAGNLRRLGVTVDTGPDWIRIHPGTPVPGRVETFRDHRIAMAFSIAGLRTPGITLNDPACVKKTFPTFHDVLAEVVTELVGR